MTMKWSKTFWMGHHSVQSWNDAALWDDYLRAVESILNDRLAKLDANDPARRKADTARGEGHFVTQFGAKEDGRWLLGRFEKTKIWFVMQHYKNGRDSFGRRRDNTITFHFPEKAHASGVEKLVELFHLTNERLGIFYAAADSEEVYCAKKASPPSLGALNIASELLGVFWLTYFGPNYCEFFGQERFAALEQVSGGPASGMTLQLAETPGQVPEGLRRMLERRLGAESFAGIGDVSLEKPEGRYALTLEQLAAIPANHSPKRRNA